MNWPEALARIASGEPVMDVLDAKSAADRERVRSILADHNPAFLATFDAEMRDLDSGIMGARDCWHSISVAQRRVLESATTSRSGRLIRANNGIPPRLYVIKGDGPMNGAWIVVARDPRTIRALCAHDLMAWDGGLPDPEAAAVITERGRFVLAHGRTQQTP